MPSWPLLVLGSGGSDEGSCDMTHSHYSWCQTSQQDAQTAPESHWCWETGGSLQHSQSLALAYSRWKEGLIWLVCGLLITQEGGSADVSLLLRIFFGTVPLDLLPAALHRSTQPPLHAAQRASCSQPPHRGRTPGGALGGWLGEDWRVVRRGVA